MTTAGVPLTNWSGSVRYRAAAVERPADLDALRACLARGPGPLAVLATRHAFNAIGDATTLIGLDRLPGAHAIEIDATARTATVGPCVTYAALAAALAGSGLALPNLASLPHISVAGGIATATHGSGRELGCLSTSVAAIELMSAGGERVSIGPGDPRLPGASVHLGALGVVLAVRLGLVPAYELRQDVYLDLEWAALDAEFETVMSTGRSVSVFHDFGDRARQVWVKCDPADAATATATLERLGAHPAQRPCHPVPGGAPENCTEQLGVTGRSDERLPHFRAGFTPSAGEEIQSEWFVPRTVAPVALRTLRERLGARIRPHLLVAELRTIARDELWMSPHHGRDSAGLHFTWRREPAAVDALIPEIERVLAPLHARPHWGKRFDSAPAPARLGEFRALRAALDPDARFLTDWHRAHVDPGER